MQFQGVSPKSFVTKSVEAEYLLALQHLLGRVVDKGPVVTGVLFAPARAERLTAIMQTSNTIAKVVD